MPADIPVVGPFVNKIFGTRNERIVKRYTMRVGQINAQEPKMRGRSDAELRTIAEELRERAQKGASGEELIVDAFALAREVMDRSIGIRNIFNPKHREAFPADKLPDNIRALYDQTIEKMDSAEPREPAGDLLGCAEPQPGWVWEEIPTEIYEAVREIFPDSKPPFRARPFDVQLIGGMVLFQGSIAEMKTGEGKTIVAPLASFVAALTGRKVHVVTVNDYLVQRDRDWTFPFFRAIGLTVGAIHPQHMQDENVKRAMYHCDVVYGTTSEFGFDYLRDNMKRSVDQQVQRVREFAIVDEVDSILIDEARTPLIISGPAHEEAPRYDLADQLARYLVELQQPWTDADKKVKRCLQEIKGAEGDIRNAREKGQIPALQDKLRQFKAQLPDLEADRGRHTQYFEVEMDKKQAYLTHHGIAEAQKKADVGSFYVGENIDLPHLMEQSIRAHAVYERDRDYIIMPSQNPQTGRQEASIVIVDTNTGRPMIGRQWSDGLHQAVEAKEKVPIKQETQTVATITIQNFFKMYKRLAGMTGTADTEAQEFHDIYKLDVVAIPTNVQVIRRDFDDVVYLTAKDKWDSIVEEIKAFHDIGSPVLVGTTSVEKSEMLAKMLNSKHGIKHEVLNAKQHEREAHIVENAGALGAVMIATNMAGRGTDIKLARVTRQEILDHWLRRGIAPRELTVEDDDRALREKVFRKVAPKELGLNKRDVEGMGFEDLELALLRHWATDHTWAEEKKINQMSVQQLEEELDAQGRFMLHRIRWVDNLVELGGLHVIGTERHESRRIDNQLRGRSGRQGDKGSSRFFVGLDDDLMSMFAGNTTMKILSRLGMKEGDAIEHPMLSKSIVRAQRKVEERNFQVRKNILEYDEVMEYQRQEFYGMRQRVLEGRDVKGMIFEFIEDAVGTASHRYLAKDYFAECVAEFATERLGCSIEPERFRRRDKEDAEDLLRRAATDDARHEIDVTIGEYIPDDSDITDIDSKGLSSWALSRFKIDLPEGDIHEMSTQDLKQRLLQAAEAQISGADLSGLEQYLVNNFGAQELSKWVKRTFDLEVPASDLSDLETVGEAITIIVDKVRERYDDREIEYPVQFAMEMTSAMIRQHGPQAGASLVQWANARYGLGWDESVTRTRMPQQIRDDLLRASRQYVESGKMQEQIQEALSHDTSDEAIQAYLTETYNAELPDWILRLQGDERAEALRARVESILRSELLQFERFVMLEVLDTAWKDHLYGMDQLRDGIGFRAISQRDPRIEYKREGARLFQEMMERVRDRVAEYVFRLKLTPNANQPPARGPAPQAAPSRAAPAPAGIGGSSIAGPGFA